MRKAKFFILLSSIALLSSCTAIHPGSRGEAEDKAALCKQINYRTIMNNTRSNTPAIQRDADLNALHKQAQQTGC